MSFFSLRSRTSNEKLLDVTDTCLTDVRKSKSIDSFGNEVLIISGIVSTNVRYVCKADTFSYYRNNSSKRPCFFFMNFCRGEERVSQGRWGLDCCVEGHVSNHEPANIHRT